MSKVKSNRLVCLILIALSLLMFMCQPVHAASSDVDSVVSVVSGSAEISRICSQANNSVGGTKILEYDSANGVLGFKNSTYSSLDIEQKRTFMETALSATKECGLGTQQKNKVYNFIADQDSTTSAAMKYLKSDTSADFVAAQAWFRPFSNPISTIMGVLCLLIFIFMGLSMVFDIAYLVLPGFQLILERGDEHKRPFGVSKEAWKANRETESVNVSDNVLTVYLKKRIPVMLLIAICLGYLISGKIYDLFIWFIDAYNI